MRRIVPQRREAGANMTDLAVIDIQPDGLVLRELAPGVTEQQVIAATAVPLLGASQL